MSFRSFVKQVIVNINDYRFWTLDPPQKTWDPVTLPPKPGRTQRNYDDYVFYTLKNTQQQSWDNIGRPPKPLPTQKNYDDYIFYTLQNTQKQSWDNLAVPPIPRPSIKPRNDDLVLFPVQGWPDYSPTPLWKPKYAIQPYVDDLVKIAVAAPAQTVWDQPTIPSKPRPLIQVPPDYGFTTTSNVVQTTWDPQGLPPKPGRTQRNYDDYNFYTLQNTNQQSWDSINRPSWPVKSNRSSNDELLLFPIQGWPDDHVYPPSKPRYILQSPIDSPAPVTVIPPTYPPIWDNFIIPPKGKFARGLDDAFVLFVSNVPPPPPIFTPNVRIGTQRGAYLSDPDNPNIGGQF